MYAFGAHFYIPELVQAAAWGIHGFWEWIADDQWVVDGQFKDQLEDWGDLFLACTRTTFEVVWHPDTEEDDEVKDIMVGFARHKMFAGGYGDNEVAAYRARLKEVPGYTLAYERHRCVHCPKGVNALENRVAAAAG